jgi:hypothetical protein
MHQAIDAMKYFYMRALGQQESWPSTDATPELIEGQIRAYVTARIMGLGLEHLSMAYQLAVEQGIPTIWCYREHHGCTGLFMAICAAGGISADFVLAAALRETDFETLVELSGRISKSPLQLLDANDPQQFLEQLRNLPVQRNGTVLYCDWAQDEDELVILEELSRPKNVRLSFRLKI